MPDVGEIFVRKFVVGWGLLNGIWFYAGVNPESEIVNAFLPLLPASFQFLILITSIISTVASFIVALREGGEFGILAIVLAFIGGIFILNPVGIVLIIMGILVGYFAAL